MNSGKYFSIFVGVLFCIVIAMYSGDIGYRVGTADSWKQEQSRRFEAIDRVCKQNGSTPIFHEIFLYIKEYNLLFCVPPKAGSTTWTGGIFPKFSKLESKFAGKEVHKSEGLRSYFEDEVTVKNMKQMELILERNPFTFTNVRHPFERLVSAYVDFIVKRLHGNWFPKIAHQPFDTFVKDLVLKEAEESPNDKLYSKMNIHWRPFNSLCSFCNVRYNAISKMETFDEDKRHILEMLGEGGEEEVRLGNVAETPTADLTRKYFRNLSEELRLKLSELYKYDLDMFSYDKDFYY